MAHQILFFLLYANAQNTGATFGIFLCAAAIHKHLLLALVR